MKTTPEMRLRELLKDFDMAMLVTHSQNGQLRSRPMAIADVQPDGTLTFVTDRNSGKIHEISGDSHVNVTMQSRTKFVSLSGTAAPVDNRRMIADQWKEGWKVWFPGGKDDPSLILLEVHGETGEYWDNSGTSGIKYLIEAGRAYLTGTRPDVAGDPKIHAKVSI